MSACSKCGAPSDPILSNCLYCGAGLDKRIISDSDLKIEEILSKCSEYIGKYESLTENFMAWNAAKQADVTKNSLGGGLLSRLIDKNAISIDSIRGAITEYLTILEVKSGSSESLGKKIRELKHRFNECKQREKKYDRSGKKMRKYTFIGALTGFVLLMAFMMFMASSENHQKAVDKEHERLTLLIDEITSQINQGNINGARLKLTELEWRVVGEDSDKILIDKWNAKKEEIKEIIDNYDM